jgi:hypothetical protein
MKNYIASITAAAALVIFIFGIDCMAQSSNRVIATIPFEFNVGNETLPAGQYEFKNLTRQAYPGNLVVRSMDAADGRSVVIPALPNPATKAGDSVGLVFHRYGSSYFLSRIDLRASDLAVRFGRTSAERQLAREFQRPVAVLIRPSSQVKEQTR